MRKQKLYSEQILKKITIITTLITTLIMVSCDARLHMTYLVKNKSSGQVTLFIPNFPKDTLPRLYRERTDTTLTLKPNEEIIVGLGSKIDFPWATKNIYKDHPGVCGIKKITSDTITNFGCSKKEWKYKKGSSYLKVK